jgi:hypothetical protein
MPSWRSSAMCAESVVSGLVWSGAVPATAWDYAAGPSMSSMMG